MENQKLNKLIQFMNDLKETSKELGAEVALITPNDLLYDEKARNKCVTCKRFGTKATCPPNIPEPFYFKELFSCYRFGLIVGIKRVCPSQDKIFEVGSESSTSLHKILLELERQSFERGYVFATSFIGGSCKMCGTKTCNFPCVNPTQGRIPLESTGVDIIGTCKEMGLIVKFPIKINKQFWRIGLVLVA